MSIKKPIKVIKAREVILRDQIRVKMPNLNDGQSYGKNFFRLGSAWAIDVNVMSTYRDHRGVHVQGHAVGDPTDRLQTFHFDAKESVWLLTSAQEVINGEFRQKFEDMIKSEFANLFGYDAADFEHMLQRDLADGGYLDMNVHSAWLAAQWARRQ